MRGRPSSNIKILIVSIITLEGGKEVRAKGEGGEKKDALARCSPHHGS
jgi:hypothetical protein